MPTPHDYYDIHGMPRLHNVGEGRPYLENNYHADDAGPQVPSLSTIGRGPRGEGLTVGNVVNENGTVSFALYSDLTGELVWQSPNLDPGTLDFYPADFRDLTAGQPAPMDIVHTKGGVTKTTTAYLPCGERGSLVFLLGGRSVPRVPSDTYQTTAEELMIYGHRVWPNDNKPLPHVNDIVFFRYTDGDETGFAFGTIETVGTRNNEETVPSTPVVYTARVFVPCTGGGTADPLIIEALWGIYDEDILIPDDSKSAQLNKDEDLRTVPAPTNQSYVLYCAQEGSNNGPIFTEAEIVYEAFTSGRPVFIHAQNIPESFDEREANVDQYYKIIDAYKSEADRKSAEDPYFGFVAAIPDVNTTISQLSPWSGSFTDCPIKNIRSSMTFADGLVAFYCPAESGNNCKPLIVEAEWVDTPTIDDEKATKAIIYDHPQELRCYETAQVMYEAFASGKPVLLATNGGAIYKITDATMNLSPKKIANAGGIRFTALLPDINAEYINQLNIDVEYKAVLSYECSDEDYPVFYPKPSFLVVDAVWDTYPGSGNGTALHCLTSAEDMFWAFFNNRHVLLYDRSAKHFYKVINAYSYNGYYFTAAIPNKNLTGEQYDQLKLVVSENFNGYPVFYPKPSSSPVVIDLTYEEYEEEDTLVTVRKWNFDQTYTAQEIYQKYTMGIPILLRGIGNTSTRMTNIISVERVVLTGNVYYEFQITSGDFFETGTCITELVLGDQYPFFMARIEK